MAATKTYYNFVDTVYFAVDAYQPTAFGSAGYLGRYDEDASFHIFDSTGAIKFSIYNVPESLLANTVTAGHLTVASSIPAVLSTAPATGWVVPTGTMSHATFITDSVTLPELAASVGQLIIDLKAQGYIK